MQDIIIKSVNDGSAILGIIAGIIFWIAVVKVIFDR